MFIVDFIFDEFIFECMWLDGWQWMESISYCIVLEIKYFFEKFLLCQLIKILFFYFLSLLKLFNGGMLSLQVFVYV